MNSPIASPAPTEYERIAKRASEIAEDLRAALPRNTDFGDGWQQRYLDRQNERFEKALEMARAEAALAAPTSAIEPKRCDCAAHSQADCVCGAWDCQPVQAQLGTGSGAGAQSDSGADSGHLTSRSDPPSMEGHALLQAALSVVTTHRRASISLVQRHLRIGYNLATRLLEQLLREGRIPDYCEISPGLVEAKEKTQ